MIVGVMKDSEIKPRDLHVSDTYNHWVLSPACDNHCQHLSVVSSSRRFRHSFKGLVFSWYNRFFPKLNYS